MNTKLVISLIIICFAVIFIIQNAAVVDTRFLFWTISMSRSLLIFIFLAIGIISGWILHSFFLHKKNKE
ncbi:lipopolysaccharide assembly protein LapA domain-containing protein [candidate division KSB1 bacterium]